ncbi:glycoside hydrolase family 9 protein [Chitinophaga sp. XS-30]|uniref:glycoside hydrolase family 9 protein n=1 Tax=Chitinophaga sp. XS-30 TaxID=2604421 RepID=UPI0011DE3AD3|nr:glycoside hydrolase family 9 protein [Chitinophaga sp. XS-30]QEH39932.1 glycoside hydrolase [Chitinophaga sp. XS-30]
MKRLLLLLLPVLLLSAQRDQNAFIRINQLGYLPAGVKVAVWGSLENNSISSFQLIDSATGKTVYTASAGQPFGSYGPFQQSYRLDFSAYSTPGTYYLRSGNAQSPVFRIGQDVYNGTADFCLRYLRQQRCGFNPFLEDSCHTRDGYTLYGPMPDSTYIDVVGGWHDASDYLQYSTTSANTAYHLLAAYRDFPAVFSDRHDENGLQGRNNVADVLDEARWGLDWLLKMHPREDWLFNQIADDRDHRGMRIPALDSFYGRGFERPVYFCSGEPQVQGVKYNKMNRSDGVASTAGKFASTFALGYSLLRERDADYAATLLERAGSAYRMGVKQPGVQQTASVLSPYIYAEDNWTDDMELAAAQLHSATGKRSFLEDGRKYAAKEEITPWLGADTANHYQWYPFINIGHYELAKQVKGKQQRELTGYYRTGIDKVWQKARQNAFYRGVPFIWCSNNLTTAFAIQCYWYQQLSGDDSYAALAQANVDWLFGCNPWGTGMVYGLPAYGDTPVDPHSAFTHLKNYPIDGGLVDGPVYGTIYNSLIGIRLADPDEYAAFQSNLVVYHDDYGDYSTNEPTMDGTASLVYLLALKENEGRK